MKSYEEMTNAVLLRAGAEKVLQKRRQRRMAAVLLCSCLVAFVMFAGAKHALPMEEYKSRVSMFYVAANASEQQQMLVGQKIPYNALIRVHDITTLDDQQVKELQVSDKEYAQWIADQNLNDDPGNPNWSISSTVSDQTMVSTIYIGSYYLTVDDYSQIRDVSTSTTQIGWAALHLADYHDESVKDGIGITWSLSGTGVDMIAANPEMNLTEITDTITVTVEFKDGTKEIASIVITVDDDGQIYGTFQGTILEE